MFKRYIILSTLLAILTMSMSHDPVKKLEKLNLENLPGVMKLNTNLYLDQFEITNFNWLEYTYWTKRVFGDSSDEYLSSLPDTTVWAKKDSSYAVYEHVYHKHPTYSNYPVVGISHSQAVAFSKWRSDRVFEFLLIKYEVLAPNPKANAETYFTIERFFKDPKYKAYHGVKYPCYELVSKQQWNEIVEQTNASHQETMLKCDPDRLMNKIGLKPKYCDNIIKNKKLSVYSIERLEENNEPVTPVNSLYVKDMYFHLFGNVCELTAEGEYTVGGGWVNTESEILSNQPEKYLGPNCWTGFRNVCSWKNY